MSDPNEIFTEERVHLRAVAYRLLGSVHEADDAVQETWLRLQRTDTTEIDNLPAWLTTVVSRICLDLLRSRTARREDLGAEPPVVPPGPADDPASRAEQSEAVGRALMVVLESLRPSERLAFCLHDIFGMSFDEIAPALGRSATACRQLASRARRRVRGQNEAIEVDRDRQREVVDAFLDAARNGRFERLLAVLHPEAQVTADTAAAAMGSPARLAGPEEVARFFSGRAKAARPTELDGYPALMWAQRGEVKMVFAFNLEDGLIREVELLGGDVSQLDLG